MHSYDHEILLSIVMSSLSRKNSEAELLNTSTGNSKNWLKTEIQKEVPKQTVELRQALDLAINMELRMRNQYQNQQHNTTLIPVGVNAIQYSSSSRSSNWSISSNFHKQGGNRPPLYCSNCGRNWLPNHRERRFAKGKTCNHCGLLDHFAKICRKQKNQN